MRGDTSKTLCDKLENLIKNEDNCCYGRKGHELGWRLFYSPKETLDSAEYAIIGTNPGGTERQPAVDKISTEQRTSAFCCEKWRKGKHYSSHQHRAQNIISTFKVEGHEVLAGNLVPFRSQNWLSLPQRDRALAFGLKIWSMIFEYRTPRLIVAHGEQARFALMYLLSVQIYKHDRNSKTLMGRFPGGTFIGVPHLSCRPKDYLESEVLSYVSMCRTSSLR